MNLIVADIRVVHCELVEVSGDMVSSTGVRVPVVVTVGGGKASRPLLNRGIFLITILADLGGVTHLATDLALWA
jgi:hypothetical protein